MRANTARTHRAVARSETVPVLIAGAGPAGLTLSLLLARFGVESMIVERRLGLSVLPRATGVNLRSMEIYRGLGLGDAIDAVSMPTDVPFVLIGETLATPPQETVASNHWGPSPDPAWPSPSHANWCAQDRLEAVLLEALREEAGARLRFGNELVSFQTADDVAAVTRDGSGRTRTVRARYLVGADGTNSCVRDSLGIVMRGQGALSSDLNILFDAELEPLLDGRRFCMYRITRADSSGVLRPTGRPDRWLFDTPGNADTGKEPLVERIRAAAGDPRLDVEIVATGAWEACARVADSFREGPVLLIGDAAHQHTPGGGFGMNSAIQGAHNLAWKLTAVLHDHAGDGLLDTYQTERRPLAELTTSLSIPLLQARGRASGRTLGIVLGARYEQGALVPDRTPPPPAADPVADYTRAHVPVTGLLTSGSTMPRRPPHSTCSGTSSCSSRATHGCGKRPLTEPSILASRFACDDCPPSTPRRCTASRAPGPRSSDPTGTSPPAGPRRPTPSSRRSDPPFQASSAGTTDPRSEHARTGLRAAPRSPMSVVARDNPRSPAPEPDAIEQKRRRRAS